MPRGLLLLSSVCTFLACGGKSESPRVDTGADGAETGADDALPAGATLALDRYRVDLGRVVLGSSAVATLTLTNRGASTSGAPTVSVRMGDLSHTTAAESVRITGCEGALPPGGSCVLELGITPTALGSFDARVEIVAVPGTSYLRADLVGWAIGFEVSPHGDVDLGDGAPGVPIRGSFTVTALIDVSNLTFDTNGQELVIDRDLSTCTAVLPKGASCEIAVELVASTIGWKHGSLGIAADGQSDLVYVMANVTRSNDLAIAPSSPTALTCIWGQIGPPAVFTLTNVGPTSSGTIVAAIIGPSSSETFVISRTDCAVLALRATCTIEAVCDGNSESDAPPSGILTVSDGNTHLSVPLSTDGFRWP